ncbi:hypothetical protein RCH06_003308 [Polaromonas sp. CG_9.5]|uniref:hypothetical protein n=1 Tax=Polaromonas sp. CG_9.5 TaxID=3071705 RepID=UPI002DFB6219|nr:hypothetical protein [Polaromonas sp. CG_9.5]
MSAFDDNDRALCAATGRLLQASDRLSAWGLGVTVVGMVVLALTGRSLPMVSWLGFAAVVMLGLPERYLAFRLRFDAGLFNDLAAQNTPSLAALDNALQRLDLRNAPDAPRTLQDRVLGARQLLQRHGIVVVCQSVLFLLALLTQDLR